MIMISYTWEAEANAGTIMTTGGDLSDCIRFSLIPVTGSTAPRHDIAGVKLNRRFIRHFQKVKFNDLNMIPGGLKWEDGSCIVGAHEDLQSIIHPGYLIRQCGPEDICPWCAVVDVSESSIIIDAPYNGRSAAKCNSRFHIPVPADIILHCIVGDGWRMWINGDTGAMLMTPEDQEVYL